MPWQVTFHNDLRVVEIIYIGLLKPADLLAAAEATLALTRRHAASRFLTDCTQLRGGHSVFDLYALIDFFEINGLPRTSKEALLFPQAGFSETSEHVEFWETACRNRGYLVRIFHDREAALRWLCE